MEARPQIFVITVLIILMIASYPQAQEVGTSKTGLSTVQGDATLRSFGAVEAFDAKGGFVLGGAGVNTNIVQWHGIQGSQYYWSKMTTNFPAYVASITTNSFPAINFEVGTSNQMFEHRFAPLFTTGKPITVVMCECTEGNGVALNSMGFGWTLASNAQSSILRFAPHAGNATTAGAGLAFDTNQAIININQAGGSTTNRWNWYLVSYSNGTAQIMQNLLSTQTTIANPGQLTFDTCTLGGNSRTNFNLTGVYNGRLSFVGIFTNANFDGAATNLMNYLDNTYDNGRLKVY